MARFERFTFRNENGIDVKVALELPIGTAIGEWHVGPGQEITPLLTPAPNAIRDAKIVVSSDRNHEADTQTFSFDGSSAPHRCFISVLSAASSIGKVSGRVELVFGSA